MLKLEKNIFQNPQTYKNIFQNTHDLKGTFPNSKVEQFQNQTYWIKQMNCNHSK
jgi:hypothetical protein